MNHRLFPNPVNQEKEVSRPAMITPAQYGETSWELAVQVDEKEGVESMKFKLRVAGDLHIGGLMLKLVEKISEFPLLS